MTAVEGSILGNAVLRKEDPSLLTGEDSYYDDLTAPGMAFVHFVRSPFAHATIGTVDISEATSMPGVIAVYTDDNLEIADHQGFAMFDAKFNRPQLARGKVRFVGDIVAAVVAETRGQAADAAESVMVDYDPLPAVTDATAALAEGAPILFEEVGSNQCFETAVGAEEDPLVGASKTVEGRIVSQRLAGVPMETNGCLSIPGDNGHMTVMIPSQNPIAVRDAIVAGCGLDADNLRVAAPKGVGGGFGPKAGVYIEHMLTTKIAQTLNQPVKWTELRSENMVSMAHGRDMVLSATMGFDDNNVLTGIDIKVIADAGAYPAIGGFLTVFTQMMCQGVYHIPKLRFHALSAVTNTTTTAAYRGAGRPEATQMLERMMDIAAVELGEDPADLRKKSFIKPDAFPFATHGGTNYDNGEYEMVLDAALAEAGYADMLSEQAARRASGDPKQIGIGLSTYVEVTAPAGLHVEYGKVEVNADGTVTARVGTSAHGQGHETAFSMIVSDMLGVPMEDVTILMSDTDEVPRGSGTMGSRSLQTAGSAVHVASETVLEKAKKLAAHQLEAAESDIVVGNGGLQVAGVPTSALSWAQLYTAANDSANLPEGVEPGLEHELDFDGQDATFPFGAHVSMVEVDTDTGEVTILRHVAVDDCGRILNPLIVTGQQHGGIAQGIAQALFEQVKYDEDGNPITSNLMDYAIPSAAELINFETHNTETPTFRNPMGAKGIGESGTIGSTPAVHNAVINAVSHLGVRHIDMPLTSLTVWEAIHAS